MKRLLSVILALTILLVSVSAFALTGAEKEQKYDSALNDLETWLQEPGKEIESLRSVIAAFDELKKYSFSNELYYYAAVLEMAVEDNCSDWRVFTYLNALNKNEAFMEYLHEGLKSYSVGTVEELAYYTAGRKAENEGDKEKAAACYFSCIDFYDSFDRIELLTESAYKTVYEQGLSLMDSGDLDEAYLCLIQCSGYKESDMICDSIIELLGYDPSHPHEWVAGPSVGSRTCTVCGKTETDTDAMGLTEGVDENGQEAVFLSFYLLPGESAVLRLPAYEDQTVANTGESILNPNIAVPKVCFYPNAPLTESVYTAVPEIVVTHTDGTEETRKFDAFVMTFSEVSLSLDMPDTALTTGIMAEADGSVPIHGFTTDHTVRVAANGQPMDVFLGGEIKDSFTFAGSEPETVTVTASADNMVSKSLSFRVLPYVFVPEKMILTVDGSATGHKANVADKVTLTGTVVKDSKMTVSCDGAEAGNVIVKSDGTYSVTLTFKPSFYGLFKVDLTASREGYEEGKTSAYIYRMIEGTGKTFRTNFTKKMSPYFEVYAKKSFDDLLAEPSQTGGFRFAGKIVSAFTDEDGLEIVEVLAESAKKKTETMYFINMDSGFRPSKATGRNYYFYATLNGLYKDTEKLCAVCWNAVKK